MSTQKESTTVKKTSVTAKNGEVSQESKTAAISKVKQLTKQITPDSRLSAINILQKLADKVKYLRGKQDEVNLFVAESDNLNRTINLDNGKNVVLTVNNSVVNEWSELPAFLCVNLLNPLTMPNMYFKISTFTNYFNFSEDYKYHFFILSRGSNTGRPERTHRPNCWVFESNQKRDFEILEIVFYSQVLKIHLRGSVIEFIPLADYRKIITPIIKKSLNRHEQLNARYLQLNKLNDFIQNQKQRIKLAEQLKQKYCHLEINTINHKN